MISGGRTYEGFRKDAPDAAPLLDAARSMCMGIGDSVVEDVRMHRVVYCRGMTFRWFADVEPRKDHIVVKLQRGRREEPGITEVSDMRQLELLAPGIRDAYDRA